MIRPVSRSVWVLGLCVFVLGGCDRPASTRVTARPAAAASVPSGTTELPEGDLRVPDLPPVALYDAFVGLAPHGIAVHLAPSREQPRLLLLVVDLAAFEPMLLGVDDSRRGGWSALDTFEDGGVDAVVGSGFVAELNSLTPVGLLQLQGVVVSDLQRHGYTRILGVRVDGLGVVHKDRYNHGLFDSAIQVGPGIVEDGRLDISERDLQRPMYYRTFVATCGDRAAVGASLQPAHLHTLGALFVEFARDAGLACDEVVNLAGDREVVLAVRNRSSVAYLGHPSTAKAALLGFRRRDGGS